MSLTKTSTKKGNAKLITLSNALAARFDITGFLLTVAPCSFWMNGTLVNVPQTTLALPQNSRRLVYLDVNSATILLSATVFPVSSIPIAVVTTDFRGVVSLVDSRPDFLVSGGGSGGGSTTVSISTSTVLSNVSAGFMYVFATGGSGGGITITYPSASFNAAGTIVVKKIDSGVGPVIVSANLDGGGNYALTNQNQYVSGASDGSNWWIVDNN